jgi:hypothetical protein
LSERVVVAGAEVHRVHLVELTPWELVGRAGAEPLSHHGDSPLAVSVDVRERTALGLGAIRRLDAQAHGLERGPRAVAEVVVPEGGEERAVAGELQQLHGRDWTAPGGNLEHIVGVDDLTGGRDVVDTPEGDPFDVTDDRRAHPQTS